MILSEDEKKAIEKVRTVNVEAYDYYIRGRQFFHQLRRKSLEYARQMFNRAIEVDPEYALAHAGVADSCSLLYMYFDARELNLRQADLASRKALELEPDLAEAHVARGLAVSLSKKFDEAAREFEPAYRKGSPPRRPSSSSARPVSAPRIFSQSLFSPSRIQCAEWRQRR